MCIRDRPSIFTCFSQGSILESLVIKFFELTKLFNICWNRVLFILYLGSHFQQKLNNFANSDFFFTKLSRIDPCEKRVNILGGQHWRNFLMACSKLVTMAIYVVKQACGNEIMPSVYSTYYCPPFVKVGPYLKRIWNEFEMNLKRI